MTWITTVSRMFSPAAFDSYAQTIPRLTRPEFIVLHGTGSPTRKQRNDDAAHVSDEVWLGEGYLVHNYRDIQGWSAGPNLFVTDRGLGVFTPLNRKSIGSPDWNEVGILHVETVGNWTLEEWDGTPTKANAIDALGTLFRWMKLPVNTDTLRFHYEDSAGYGHPHGTTHIDCPCHPGGNITKPVLINEILAAMAAKKGA